MCVEAGTRRSANHTQGHVAFGRALVKGNVRNGMALGSVCVCVCVCVFFVYVREREREREREERGERERERERERGDI